MTRLRLLKLLYIADRESIQETAFPITSDKVVAMDHGPVLSETYDLIKGEAYASFEWRRYIHSSDQLVILTGEPGVEQLSRYEIRKLREVAKRFEGQNDWDVANYTHTFPEWQQNQPEKGGSNRIHVREILEALGMADAADEILAEARSYQSVDQAFARAGR